MRTPQEDSFYMPAEWQPHTRCWMGWPCRPLSWPFALSHAQTCYLAVAQAISYFEPVTLVAVPKRVNEARAHCNPQMEVVVAPMDDAWLRDMGPTFVINGQGHIAGVNWLFNAWGGSHPDHQQDTTFAEHLLTSLQVTRYAAPLVLEGGSIHVDGAGTVLTTEECLLHSSRNPHLTRNEIESWLQAYLGVRHIIWLGQGLQDDETHGHVDNLACFVRPHVVVALTTSDKQDSNYHALQDNLRRLQLAKDAHGNALEIITIEQPASRYDANGLRLALSYINFYLANGGVIMPIFGDSMDKTAYQTLSQLFPERRIVTVPALDLVYGGGGIHCITQQQPSAIV